MKLTAGFPNMPTFVYRFLSWGNLKYLWQKPEGPRRERTELSVERTQRMTRDAAQCFRPDGISDTLLEEIAAVLLHHQGGRERVVQIPHRVRWRHNLQLEVGELLHLRKRRHGRVPNQTLKRLGKVVKRNLSAAGIGAVDSDGPVATPVHRASIPQATQSLGHERSLHGMELVDRCPR